jgi:UDP:flavonoid glycosyltransferase YjiC (YdhE family)
VSRFLFVVPPLVGHINPVAAVAAELGARGHQVAWAGRPRVLSARVADGAKIYRCAGPDSLDGRDSGLRGVAALRFLWEDFFGPLAQAMAPGVTAAVDSFAPDLVVTDQQAVAGALVAERRGLPFVTSATTSADLAGGATGLPKVDDWVLALLHRLRQRIGDPAATHDPRFSPWLTLAFTTPELAGPQRRDEPVRYTGPALTQRPDTSGFPWEWLTADPAGHPERDLVLVTLGTASHGAGARFLTECVRALRSRRDRLRAVIADPDGVFGPPGGDADILCWPTVPQLPLLDRARAVICHAGHNTVAEALWHGVPLLVAPIRDDQPVIAGQVTAAGAGIRLRFGRADHQRIGTALDMLLEVEEDPRFIRDGADLIHELPVTFSQAALGTEIEVPTVDGTARVKIPAGTQSGKVLRLRGRGLPHLQRSGRGDQIVRIIVWTPTNLTPEQTALFERLAEVEGTPPREIEAEESGGLWSKLRGAFSA